MEPIRPSRNNNRVNSSAASAKPISTNSTSSRNSNVKIGASKSAGGSFSNQPIIKKSSSSNVNTRKGGQPSFLPAAEKASKNNRERKAKLGDEEAESTDQSEKALKINETFFEKLYRICMGREAIEIFDRRTKERVEYLNLTQSHLQKLKHKFNEIDVDGTGDIEIFEFLEHLGEAKSPFTEELFAMVALKKSGAIEFDEYVLVVATYCMFTKDDILRFCFDCFDVDRSGSITENEFIELCRIINNGAPVYPGNFKRALEEFDANQDGALDYGEFTEMERRYPMILFPAFRLQDMMQRQSLGERTWLKISERLNRAKFIAEYRNTHGGRNPPLGCWEGTIRYFFPYSEVKETPSVRTPGVLATNAAQAQTNAGALPESRIGMLAAGGPTMSLGPGSPRDEAKPKLLVSGAGSNRRVGRI